MASSCTVPAAAPPPAAAMTTPTGKLGKPNRLALFKAIAPDSELADRRMLDQQHRRSSGAADDDGDGLVQNKFCGLLDVEADDGLIEDGPNSPPVSHFRKGAVTNASVAQHTGSRWPLPPPPPTRTAPTENAAHLNRPRRRARQSTSAAGLTRTRTGTS